MAETKISLPLDADEDPKQPLQLSSPGSSVYESATERSIVKIPKLDLTSEPGSSAIDEHGTDETAVTARTHQSGGQWDSEFFLVKCPHIFILQT